MSLTLSAPAKINLGLHVLRKRADGYHDIETVFHRIGWADTVTLEPADRLAMTCSDPNLPTDTDNLCLQAAHRLAERVGTSHGATLHLEKRVPYGAGLGGGSSDAAATLKGLVRLWDLDVAPATLRKIGASIGSDVPFFLMDEETPCAYATGRGDQLSPLRIGERAVQVPHTIVVVAPPVEVPTPEAYRRVTPDATDRPDLRGLVAAMDLGRWRAELANDFAAPIAEAYPQVTAAHDLLLTHGADYVSLSGSGAAVYGIFTAPMQAESACEVAAREGYRTHRTLPHAAEPAS
jgi:4-diphosphocytidyl-2-C-methyl-D-erythritol kinase